MHVRTATIEDASTISRARIRAWKVAYAHVFAAERLDALADEEAANWVARSIEEPRPHMHTLVAEVAGDVVGFSSLGSARDEAGVGELYAIYVLPEAWSRGIGQALMTETLSRLRGEGFAEAILWVLEDNPRTRRFYELAGWNADGGAKDEELLGANVHEIRYRIALEPAS